MYIITNCELITRWYVPLIVSLFFFFFFDVDNFKVFIEFFTVLLLFYVLVFWPRSIWDPSSLTRDQAHALEGEVLSTRLPAKSLPAASLV